MSSKRKARLEKKTREIAHQLYQDRVWSGRDGNASEDWAKASWIAQDPFRVFLFRFKLRFHFSSIDVPHFISNSFKEKTLWSWAELLLVPGLLAWGAFYLENRVEQRQERIAADQVEQEILSNYLSEMSGLLVDANLRESGPNSEAWSVAQALTSTTMKELGHQRNTLLLNFLRQSDLIGEHQEEEEESPSLLESLDLNETNLSDAFLRDAFLRDANLSGANLSDANLSDANLSDANLSDAYLSDAYLSGAILSSAILFEADLSGADLSSAILNSAILFEADLSGAILSDAYLSGASLSSANIEEAYLCNTILPSHINLDPNRDCEELGIPPNLLSQSPTQ